MIDVFGKEITRLQANRHFELLIQIKKRTHKRLAALLEDDVEALRYYCGRPGTNPVNEDLAFIFDKVAIQRILNKLEENESSGVAVFLGVRSKEDSRIGTTDTFSDIDGRPTLMIFPYTYSTTTNKLTGDPELELDLDKGTEHPGTGGMAGNNGIELPVRLEFTDISSLPDVFAASDIFKFTEDLVAKNVKGFVDVQSKKIKTAPLTE